MADLIKSDCTFGSISEHLARVFYVISNIQLSTRYLTFIVYKHQIFNLVYRLLLENVK